MSSIAWKSGEERGVSSEGRPVIAVTTGEPAGIGPEICAALARRDFAARLVLIGDRELLAQRAPRQTAFAAYPRERQVPPGPLEVLHIPLRAASTPGRLDPANGFYVLEMLDRAIAG
jgi:4-hydroxythreonine-4-phosphate dehydrogenase